MWIGQVDMVDRGTKGRRGDVLMSLRRWRAVQGSLVVVGLVACAFAARPAVADFSAGAAVRSITPEKPLPVSGGMGVPNPSTKALGQLTARVAVVKQGDTCVAFVGLDLLGFPSVLGDRVRRMVSEIPAENVLIGSTHTHSAPDCYAFPLPQMPQGHTADLAYVDFVVRQTADAIKAAYKSLEPATLKVGTDEAAERIAYNYYAPALYDRRMDVLQACDANGEPIFTLVNYAIHPEVLGAGQGVMSPDCIGPMAEKIEAKVGGVAVFMNGAQGGMVTADNRLLDTPSNPVTANWEDANTWEECERIGSLMADEALRIIGTADVQPNPALTCARRVVSIPVESEELWAVVQFSPLNYPRDTETRTVPVSINLVNLGTAQIATIPGEALPNIGFYLKRKMRGEHNLLFGLTNDAFGYILTKVDYQSFPRYDYISRVCTGEMTGEILIEEILEMVEESPSPSVKNPE
jgi:hypothetical protein